IENSNKGVFMSAKKFITVYYPYILLGLGFLILLAKCFYSFCWSDETFYFSTAYRFYQGDSIFLHEWFPTQLSGVLLLPLLALYVTITGSTGGILLFFRICFVCFALLSGIVTYRILKNTVSKTAALFCSLSVLFYAHLNIATLSYYTISIHCFLLSMLLIYHFYQTGKKKMLVISGILFALCVLALPTMAIAYFLVAFCILLLLLVCRFIKLPDSFRQTVRRADLPAVLLYTLLGICIPAVIFFAFLLTNVSLTDFINAIPYVLSDEEHGTSLLYPLKKFFIGINDVYGYAAYAGYLLILASFFLNRMLSPLFRRLFTIADLILFAVYFLYSFGHTGYIQTALCMTALPLFFLAKKKNWKLFFLLFAGGMIFSVVYSYSSNGYLYILSMGHFIASIAAILFIFEYAGEMIRGSAQNNRVFGRLAGFFCMAVICIALIQTIALRIVNIYRDAPLNKLTAKITAGPAAGLYTTPEHLSMYETVYNTLLTYCQSDSIGKKDGSIFITKLLPYGYLCTDLKCAAPTTWRTAFDSKRLEPYYKMNPDRYPDLILVLDEAYGSYDTCGDVVADPNPNANEIGGFLLDYVTENNYSRLTVPCGTLYVRPD
ncbi:MAG TPA: hypothetical protein PLU43_04350, partial [Lachnospiraceae bacterium]|nr:hypothetical protein [Lachnospiraceae bacterium]